MITQEQRFCDRWENCIRLPSWAALSAVPESSVSSLILISTNQAPCLDVVPPQCSSAQQKENPSAGLPLWATPRQQPLSAAGEGFLAVCTGARPAASGWLEATCAFGSRGDVAPRSSRRRGGGPAVDGRRGVRREPDTVPAWQRPRVRHLCATPHGEKTLLLASGPMGGWENKEPGAARAPPPPQPVA